MVVCIVLRNLLQSLAVNLLLFRNKLNLSNSFNKWRNIPSVTEAVLT